MSTTAQKLAVEALELRAVKLESEADGSHGSHNWDLADVKRGVARGIRKALAALSAAEAESPPPDVRGEAEEIVTQIAASLPYESRAILAHLPKHRKHLVDPIAAVFAARDREIERANRRADDAHARMDAAIDTVRRLEAALATERAKGVEAVAAEREACLAIDPTASWFGNAWIGKSADWGWTEAVAAYRNLIRARVPAQLEGERGT